MKIDISFWDSVSHIVHGFGGWVKVSTLHRPLHKLQDTNIPLDIRNSRCMRKQRSDGHKSAGMHKRNYTEQYMEASRLWAFAKSRDKTEYKRRYAHRFNTRA